MKKILLLLFSGITISAGAQSFTAHFTFDSVDATTGKTDPTPLPVIQGVQADSFRYQGSQANPNAQFRFSFTNWPLGGSASNNTYSAHTGSIDTSIFYSVSIRPAAYFTMTIDSITFDVRRSGTGIRTYSVRSSVDTFSTNLGGMITNGNSDLSVQPGNIFYWNLDANVGTETGSAIILGTADYQNFTTAKTFHFYGWNADAAGGTFSLDNVKIHGSVVPPTVANFSGTQVCHNDSTRFIDSTTTITPGIAAWSWNFGDTTSSSAQNPVHLYSTPGVFVVTLSVTDSAGGIYSHFDTITVNANPVAGISAFSGFCSDSVGFADNSTVLNDTISIYAWDFGDILSGANNFSNLENSSHVYSGPGNYNITHIVQSSAGCSDTATIMFSILAKPVASWSETAVTGTDYNFTDMSTGVIATYFWSFGDPLSGSANSDNSPSPSHTFSGDGNYLVCLTVIDTNGCMDTTCQNLIINTTGIADKEISQLKIYPNPASDYIVVPVTGTLSILDAQGRIILRKEISANDQVRISELTPGIYFTELYDGNQVFRSRISIRK